MRSPTTGISANSWDAKVVNGSSSLSWDRVAADVKHLYERLLDSVPDVTDEQDER